MSDYIAEAEYFRQRAEFEQGFADSLGVSIERLNELAEAEREGRVVVLLCKVGDTVYFVEKSHGRLHYAPREDKAQRISISKRGFRIMLSEHNDYRKDYALNDGVYLTRKAAEAALAAGKE